MAYDPLMESEESAYKLPDSILSLANIESEPTSTSTLAPTTATTPNKVTQTGAPVAPAKSAESYQLPGSILSLADMADTIAPVKTDTTPLRLAKSFTAGALGTAEGVGGAMQWVSGGSLGKDFADFMGGLRRQVTPEGEASFAEQVASGAGSMATFLIPGYGVFRAAGILGKVAPLAAQWLGTGAMAVTEAATEAGMVYRDSLAKTNNTAKAEDSAAWTFWLNLPVLAVTDKLAFFGKAGKAMTRALRGMVTEGTQESLQEVISTWSLEEQQNLKNILTSGAVGAIIGGGAGALMKTAPQPVIKKTKATEPLTSSSTATTEEGQPPLEVPGTEGEAKAAPIIKGKGAKDPESVVSDQTPMATGTAAATDIGTPEIENKAAIQEEARMSLERQQAAAITPGEREITETPAPVIQEAPVIAEAPAPVQEAQPTPVVPVAEPVVEPAVTPAPEAIVAPAEAEKVTPIVLEEAPKPEITPALTPAQGEIIQPAASQEATPESQVERGVEAVAPLKMGVQNVPTKEILTDPDRFQYKIGSEEQTGAGLALKDVKKWDEGLSGVLTLWRDPSGKLFVVNGHQRLSLAKRAGVDSVRTQVLDSSEWSDKEARAYGARINIAEGRGTEVDAAKFMRDAELTAQDLANEGISLSEAKTRRAIALSELSDPIFHDLTIGQFPAEQAILIGENLPGNHPAQNSIFKTIKAMVSRGQGFSNSRLKELLLLGKSAGTTSMKQATLFGEEELQGSLLMESADLMDYAKRQLRQDVHLFGLVGRKASKLKQAGNVIDPETNQLISKDSAEAIALVNKFAYYGNTESGKVLNDFAARLAEATSKSESSKVRKEFYEALKRAVTEDRSGFGLGKGSRPSLGEEEPQVGITPESRTGRGEPGEGGGQVQAPEIETASQSRLANLAKDHPYLDQKSLDLALKTFPDATDADIARMVQDPKIFEQMRRQRLQKMSDAGGDADQMQALPGLGGLFEEPGKKFSLQESTLTRGLTTEQIQSRLWDYGTVKEISPETMVSGAYGRGWLINFANDQMGIVFEAKGGSLHLLPGFGEINKEYADMGVKFGPGMKVSGSHKPMSFGSVIEMAKGEGTRTFDHELWHMVEHWLLTPQERAVLAKEFGENEEIRAEAYAKWSPQAAPNTIFQKIQEFFQRIVKAFTGMTAEDVFAKARSGEMFGRVASERTAQGISQKYSLKTLDEANQQVLADWDADTIAPKPETVSLWQRLSNRDWDGFKTEFKKDFNKQYDLWIDAWAPVERKQEALAKEGKRTSKGLEATATVSFQRGLPVVVEQDQLGRIYHHDWVEGTIPGDQMVDKGAGLSERLKPLHDMSKAQDIEVDEIAHDLFSRLMVAQRHIEQATKFPVEEHAERGIRAEQAQQVLEALKQKYGAETYENLVKLAGNQNDQNTGSIREWARLTILDRALQTGLIDQETYDDTVKNNNHWIHFDRVHKLVDGYMQQEMGGGALQALKKWEGSELKISDPYDSLMTLHRKMMFAYAKNNVRHSLAAMAELGDPEIAVVTPTVMPGLGGKGAARSPVPPGHVQFYKDGKSKWIKVPDDIYRATQHMTPTEAGLLLKIARFPAQLLRAGAIHNPEFIHRNWMRDVVQASLFSRYGFNPLKWFRDAYQIVTGNPQMKETVSEARAAGAFLATFAQSGSTHQGLTMDDILGKKSNLKYVKHPIEALKTASAFFENLTRLSLYKQAREKGASVGEAVFEARRTTLDFARMGAHPAVRYLNMIIPFWNAAIQGTDKLATELTGPNKWTVWRRMSIMATASILIAAMASQDDRYKDLEDWERNYFWHIPLGKGAPIIRLPKPFEAGILFGSIPERLLEMAFGGDSKGLKSAGKAALDTLTPDFMPTIFRPFWESYSNYNFFYGRPIEDASLQNLPYQLRMKPWTTETSKAFSKYLGPLAAPLIEISPVRFEHFVRTWTGGVGANMALPGIDALLRKAGVLEDIPKPMQQTISKMFGVSTYFTQPPTGYRAKSVNDYFESYQQVVQADQGWKLLWKSNKKQELNEFMSERPEAMFAKVARKHFAALTDMKKERTNIYESKTMSAEQKRTRLEALDNRILRLAQAGNAFLDDAIAKKVKMPPRGSYNVDEYYDLITTPPTRVYEDLRSRLVHINKLPSERRQAYIAGLIKQETLGYTPKPKKEKTKPIIKGFGLTNQEF